MICEFDIVCHGAVRLMTKTEFKTGVPKFHDGKILEELTKEMKFEYGDDTDIKKEIKGEAKVKIPGK